MWSFIVDILLAPFVAALSYGVKKMGCFILNIFGDFDMEKDSIWCEVAGFALLLVPVLIGGVI